MLVPGLLERFCELAVPMLASMFRLHGWCMALGIDLLPNAVARLNMLPKPVFYVNDPARNRLMREENTLLLAYSVRRSDLKYVNALLATLHTADLAAFAYVRELWGLVRSHYLDLNKPMQRDTPELHTCSINTAIEVCKIRDCTPPSDPKCLAAARLHARAESACRQVGFALGGAKLLNTTASHVHIPNEIRCNTEAAFGQFMKIRDDAGLEVVMHGVFQTTHKSPARLGSGISPVRRVPQHDQ